ncbi:hypothetical protein UY3_19179 [Chelonia mydas]|uniref:Uncharacterized protein n=1 Tax=Chelonia mydas TaxID=8469 RepID=M7B647_CHEMY|nr:hypothetical protein UY3_19179 [Chelonia mydas]
MMTADEEVVDSSQQASGETGFPGSQELFLTLDLEPVPPKPPKAASRTRQVEKGPLHILQHCISVVILRFTGSAAIIMINNLDSAKDGVHAPDDLQSTSPILQALTDSPKPTRMSELTDMRLTDHGQNRYAWQQALAGSGPMEENAIVSKWKKIINDFENRNGGYVNKKVGKKCDTPENVTRNRKLTM